MGGRVAEKIVFGHLNSGAANDLEQATGIARRMVREWGMSDRVGPMAWSSQQQVFLGEDLMTERPRVQRRHRQAARRGDRPHPHRAGGAGQRAAHQAPPRPRAVAEALLEQETIDGREVAQLIQQGLAESGDGDRVPTNILNPESEDLPTT